MPVADAEYRHAHRQNGLVDARRASFGDAARPAGNDDAADAGKLIGAGVYREDVALNADFANTPREQVTVLAARIENRDTLHEGIIVDSLQSTVGSLSQQSAVRHAICQATRMVARTLDELLVYQKAQFACVAVSAILERPKARADWDLRAQLAAASAAVPANIAEGFGQQTDRQFVRYLFIARGSAHEVRSHVSVAH